MVEHGDLEDESDQGDKEDEAPLIMDVKGRNQIAQFGTSAKDYLSGLSKCMEKDQHKEVLME